MHHLRAQRCHLGGRLRRRVVASFRRLLHRIPSRREVALQGTGSLRSQGGRAQQPVALRHYRRRVVASFRRLLYGLPSRREVTLQSTGPLRSQGGRAQQPVALRRHRRQRGRPALRPRRQLPRPGLGFALRGGPGGRLGPGRVQRPLRRGQPCLEVGRVQEELPFGGGLRVGLGDRQFRRQLLDAQLLRAWVCGRLT